MNGNSSSEDVTHQMKAFDELDHAEDTARRYDDTAAQRSIRATTTPQ